MVRTKVHGTLMKCNELSVICGRCDDIMVRCSYLVSGLWIERSGFEPRPGTLSLLCSWPGKTLYAHSASLHPGGVVVLFQTSITVNH